MFKEKLSLWIYLKTRCSVTSNAEVYISSRDFTRFEIYQGSKKIGSVEKPDTWTRWYSFSSDDETLATHQACLFTHGSLLDFLKEFDVCDDDGVYLGSIVGSWFTKDAAKFWFRNESGEYFAKASLSPDYSQLVIATPDNSPLYLSKKTFSFAHTATDRPKYFWSVDKVSEDLFDERFLWPFMAFVAEVWWKGLTE